MEMQPSGRWLPLPRQGGEGWGVGNGIEQWDQTMIPSAGSAYPAPVAPTFLREVHGAAGGPRT
jgi:hypothetical protein